MTHAVKIENATFTFSVLADKVECIHFVDYTGTRLESAFPKGTKKVWVNKKFENLTDAQNINAFISKLLENSATHQIQILN